MAVPLDILYLHQNSTRHNGVGDVEIIIYKKKIHRHRNRNKIKLIEYTKKKVLWHPPGQCQSEKDGNSLSKQWSMPELKNQRKSVKARKRSSDTMLKCKYPYKSNYIVNMVTECTDSKCLEFFNKPLSQAGCRIYRCQLATAQESCCCSCNSDAMFEVMKSLYDCYKKKNCDHCKCILCGHKPTEERRLDEEQKSGTVLEKGSKKKITKEYTSKETSRAEKELIGKTPAEKEKILKDLAAKGEPFPKAKTASEKALMQKVKKESAPKLLDTLKDKTVIEKENIIKEQIEMGAPVPEGRTPSEKALIAKVKATTTKKPPPSKATLAAFPPEKVKKAKAAGLLTPLTDKTTIQKENIIRGLAKSGLPLPEPKTPSEKKLIEKVRADLGLPPEPTTKALKKKYSKAHAAGLITPLEGKTTIQKEKILKSQLKAGIPLPEGRTPSEKALIAKVKETAPSAVKVPSEKLRKAKAAGLLTPLEGKTTEQKEKILKELAIQGLPLPEAKTPSDKKLVEKVRTQVGLPPEPDTVSIKEKYAKAQAAGLITPLEGKTEVQKEKILKAQAEAGLPLPEGRTPSEKAVIAKVKATKPPPSKPPPAKVPSEKLRKAKAAGLLTPLEGKPPEQKEKILKGLVKEGIPLPEPKTPSEKKLIAKIRSEMGLPPEPATKSLKQKYSKAQAAGIITPLEGKTPAQKEKILKAQAEAGLPLPEGRTPSEKALVAKVKASAPPPAKEPSEKLGKAPSERQKTPSAVKAPSEKLEKVPSERRKTKSIAALAPGRPALSPEKAKDLDIKTAKNVKEGKGPVDECICDLLTPESEKTPTEAPKLPKVVSEKLQKAKAAGLLTPLEGKTPQQKEKILKGLAKEGIPLPEPKTTSEKKLMAKIRSEVGLPPAPSTKSLKQKYSKAQAAGLLTPLEGKTPAQKEKILKAQAEAGLPLPEGRTPSEKALVAKVKASAPPPAKEPSEKLGKTPSEKRKTPSVAKAPSEKLEKAPSERRKTKAITALAPARPALPPEKAKDLDARTAKAMKEGKGPVDECICDLLTPESEKIPAEAPKTVLPKAVSEKLQKAKAAGLLTPLEGKTPKQKEKILKGLVKEGIPLPEPKTTSEKKLMAKIRSEVGLPPAPSTKSLKQKYSKAQAAGLLTPLEGKTPPQKEKILKAQAEAGLPLPEGRTPSEKALIAKVKASAPAPVKVPSEKLRKAKAAGLLTPLEGKTPEQKEKILKAQAEAGLPLPEGRTPSDKALIAKVKASAPAPVKVPSEKLRKAKAAGLLTPLEGKTPEQKEKILKAQAEAGLPLPEGRTPSDKALIAKVKASAPAPVKVPSEKLRKAKAAGLLTPLEGKTPEQKEKIIKGLAKEGIPLPIPKTPSEKKLIAKVRTEVGLPPEPETQSLKRKYSKAQAAGLITPLEGKTPAQKEKILKAQAEAGLPLPEGRTPSEKAVIAKVKSLKPPPSKIPSEKLRKAKAAGLLTPLEGKSPEQKEKILKSLAKEGIPLPEPKTPSEKKLIAKVRTEVGLPPEPEKASLKQKYEKAQAAGLITPLEGKTPSLKEKILKAQAEAGVPLPEGRTPSEKAIIAKVKASKAAPLKVPSEKLRKAKAAGLLTPLEGKSPEQKEKILKGLAKEGIPLPEPKTASEKKLIAKIRSEISPPLEPEERRKSKTVPPLGPGKPSLPPEQAKELDIKTAKNIKESKGPVDECICGLLTPESEKTPLETGKPPKIASEKIQKAKAAGLLTPLEGKTPAQKEKILKGLAKSGMPLPEAKTASEKKIMDKVRSEMGLPPEPETKAQKQKYTKAQAAGLITPLEGKTAAQKEKILKAQAEAGVPLPEGRTPSEKALIAKVKATASAIPLSKLPSAKVKELKAAGILTPLEGKTPEQKQKILESLVKAKVALPEGKTASEKMLIKKVREEAGLPTIQPGKESAVAKPELGIPPEARTASEKEVVRKAKAAGLLTPLEGKTAARKESILKGLADAGLPLPEGKTVSEKAMIKKIRATAGLPAEATSSELRKIRTKTKKVGEGEVLAKKKTTKASGAKAAGISEELEEIVKTTTCERGCGCDKKKIRFKHSYVKIRVTSPDISSLCPCPNECIPSVKGGVFTDSEGIKVTVGRAIGAPSFYMQKIEKHYASSKNINELTNTSIEGAKGSPFEDNSDNVQFIHKRNANFLNSAHSIMNESLAYHNNTQCYNLIHNKLQSLSEFSVEKPEASRYLITCSESFETPIPTSMTSVIRTASFTSSQSSYISIIVKTDSSVSFSTASISSLDTISVISLDGCSTTSTSSRYLCVPESATGDIKIKNSEYFSDLNYSARPTKSITYAYTKESRRNNDTIIIFRMSQAIINSNTRKMPSTDAKNVNMDLENQDVCKIVNEILMQEKFSALSSVFLIVSNSDDNINTPIESVSSTVCLRLSKYFLRNNPLKETISVQQHQNCGLRFTYKGKSQTFKNLDQRNLYEDSFNKTENISKNVSLYQKFDQTLGIDYSIPLPNQNLQRQITEPESNDIDLIFARNMRRSGIDNKQTQINQTAHYQQHEFNHSPIHSTEQSNDKQVPDKPSEMFRKLKRIEDYVHKFSELFERNRKIDSMYQNRENDCSLEKTFENSESQRKKNKKDSILKFVKRTESKICQVDIVGVISHRVAIDTTEDRPCCCQPKEPGVKFDNSVASEIMIPLIASQSGLSREAFLEMTTGSKHLTPQNKTTRFSSCDAPSIASYQQGQKAKICIRIDPSDIKMENKRSIIRNNQPESISCHILPEKPFNEKYIHTKLGDNLNPYSEETQHSIRPLSGIVTCTDKNKLRPTNSICCQVTNTSNNTVLLCDNRNSCGGGCSLQPLVKQQIKHPQVGFNHQFEAPKVEPLCDNRDKKCGGGCVLPPLGQQNTNRSSGAIHFSPQPPHVNNQCDNREQCGAGCDLPPLGQVNNTRRLPAAPGIWPQSPNRNIGICDNRDKCTGGCVLPPPGEQNIKYPSKALYIPPHGLSAPISANRDKKYSGDHILPPLRATVSTPAPVAPVNNTLPPPPGIPSKKRHRFMVDVPKTRTKRFDSTFVIRTSRLWNALPEWVFPDSYNLGVFKSRVNRFLLVSGPQDNDYCSACGPLPSNHKPKKKQKMKCTCGSKENIKCECQPKKWKKFWLSECPCTVRYTQTPVDGINSSVEKTAEGPKPKKCTCTKKRKRKNVSCECPYEPPPPPTIQIPKEILEKEERQRKSEMAQMTSGFNVQMKKRPIVDENMSFEEALKYYEELEARNGNLGYYDDDCDCEELDKKSKVYCECPGYEFPDFMSSSEPFMGFKVAVDGKGAASTGLSGMCCFDLCSAKSK